MVSAFTKCDNYDSNSEQSWRQDYLAQMSHHPISVPLGTQTYFSLIHCKEQPAPWNGLLSLRPPSLELPSIPQYLAC